MVTLEPVHWDAATPEMREMLRHKVDRVCGAVLPGRRHGGRLRIGHRRSINLDLFSATDELLAVESMLLFDSADRDVQPDMLIDTEWPKVREFFIAQAQALGRQWFGAD